MVGDILPRPDRISEVDCSASLPNPETRGTLLSKLLKALRNCYLSLVSGNLSPIVSKTSGKHSLIFLSPNGSLRIENGLNP